MTDIPDFTETELVIVRDTVKERYGKDIELQLADAELRLEPSARVLTACPAIFWSERGTNFVLFKVGKKAYRSQFYYRGYQQFGTGHDTYDDIGTCILTTLQVQADHKRDNPEMAQKRIVNDR